MNNVFIDINKALGCKEIDLMEVQDAYTERDDIQRCQYFVFPKGDFEQIKANGWIDGKSYAIGEMLLKVTEDGEVVFFEPSFNDAGVFMSDESRLNAVISYCFKLSVHWSELGIIRKGE